MMMNKVFMHLNTFTLIDDDNSLSPGISEVEDQMDAGVAVKLNRIMVNSMVDRCITVSTSRFD